jgi:hypothetical protein
MRGAIDLPSRRTWSLNFLLTIFLAQSTFVPWGINVDTTLSELAESFAPIGHFENAEWTRQVDGETEILKYNCGGKKGCSSHPLNADFYFQRHKLVSASLTFVREQGSGIESFSTSINHALKQAGPVVATARYVGRYTRYFSAGPWSIAWIQDGPQARVKLYVDRLNPMGRAEAVAAGGHLDLSAFPGARDYSQAHRSLMNDDWGSAIKAFEAVLKVPMISTIFARQTRFVLAMAIAADLKAASRTAKYNDETWHVEAVKKLKRAATLAPSLKSHFEKMVGELKLK